VAFHFGLEHHNRYFLLKPGYDETLADCSPGQLLVGEVLRDLSERGVEEFDFLGPQMPWKMEWTDRLRPHCWTFIIRPTPRGRFLYGARFHWGPRIKHWLWETLSWKK
jgi:CelD/BcsL family acetyltransferase involved in cellulose biosynthesis